MREEFFWQVNSVQKAEFRSSGPFWGRKRLCLSWRCLWLSPKLTIKYLARLLISGLTSSVAAMREFPVATLDLARGKNDAAIIKCSFRVCPVLSETCGPILSVRIIALPFNQPWHGTAYFHLWARYRWLTTDEDSDGIYELNSQNSLRRETKHHRSRCRSAGKKPHG